MIDAVDGLTAQAVTATERVGELIVERERLAAAIEHLHSERVASGADQARIVDTLREGGVKVP